MSAFRSQRWSVRIALVAWCLAAVVPGPGLRICLTARGDLHLGLGAHAECPLHAAEDFAAAEAAQRIGADGEAFPRVADADAAHGPCTDLALDGQRDTVDNGPAGPTPDAGQPAGPAPDRVALGVGDWPAARSRDGPRPATDDPSLARRLRERRVAVLLI